MSGPEIQASAIWTAMRGLPLRLAFAGGWVVAVVWPLAALLMDACGTIAARYVAVMKTHAEVGASLLAGSPTELLQLAEVVARTHHERRDGGGYPAGLAGDEIPLVGRPGRSRTRSRRSRPSARGSPTPSSSMRCSAAGPSTCAPRRTPSRPPRRSESP